MSTIQRAEEIFHGAVELTGEDQQQAFVSERCGADDTLRRLVEQLLAAHRRSDLPHLSHAPQLLETTADRSGPERLDEQAVRRLLDPDETEHGLGTLAGFQILSIIGQGGYGVVLRAKDARLNRLVALKMLSPQLGADPVAVRRFVREAKATASIAHDNVVAIHTVIESETTPLICMELVEGPTLQTRIDQAGPMPLEQILSIGLQIAEGLAAAHRRGIVHRDIKPANILLENGLDRVKITDFGIAQVSGDVKLTLTGHFAGTPPFMSPEQTRGETVDHRSDLFSFGAVLYQMCTGQAPFAGESILDVMRSVCEHRPAAVRKLNPDIPPWLATLIDGMLEKAPQRRPESAHAIAGVFTQGIAHLHDPSGAPPPNCGKLRQQRSPTFALPKWGLDPFILALVLALVAIAALPLVAVDNLRGAAVLLVAMLPLGGLVWGGAYRWRCGFAAVSLGLGMMGFSLLGILLIWLGSLSFNGSMTREMVLATFAFQLLAAPTGLVALFDSLGNRVARPLFPRISLRRLLGGSLLLAVAAGALRIVSDSLAGITAVTGWLLIVTVATLAVVVWVVYRKLNYPAAAWERRRRLAIMTTAFIALLVVAIAGARFQAGTYGEAIVELENLPDRCVLTIQATPVRADGDRLTRGAQPAQRIRLPEGSYRLTVTTPTVGNRRGPIAVQDFQIVGRQTQHLRLTGADLRQP
ncbi:serine/threonine-protein kinase [Roseimaritima sediminicola]|uniref:serine/threonine-protein kinase n=1 Tax=Roseimaritima sediminicola TaxID=2662066 RepID=UPI001298432E|nr:serine/threonine-protein kinase [Roseimaritima sediminicola]